MGYGDFSQTTGITDSAYNHKEWAIIQRAPTLNELLGMYNWAYTNVMKPELGEPGPGSIYPEVFDPNAQANYREKFNAAGAIQDPQTGKWIPNPNMTTEQRAEAKLAVCRELLGVLRNVDAELKKMGDEVYINDTTRNFDAQINMPEKFFYNVENVDIVIKLKDNAIIDLKTATSVGSAGGILRDFDNDMVGNSKYGAVEGLLQSRNIKTMMSDILDEAARKYNQGDALTYLDHSGNVMTREQAINQMFVTYVGNEAVYRDEHDLSFGDNLHLSAFKGDSTSYNGVSKFIYGWAENSYPYNPVQGAPIPLPGAPITFTQPGYLLKQDVIPAMDRAAYIKVRRQLSDTVGVEAWKLNSFGEGAQDAHGLHDMQIADVLGIGTQIRLGKRSMLSFDYGQNRADMGEFFHGGRDIYGDYTGGGHTPDFWVARLDIGIADTDMPGSWHAYLDYKAFDHGSFVGGTGADLPDRYLDGIRSFTTGIGYVPARNLLLEASYTFGAKSMQMRDTLYTPENFRLGDYTRVQMTYKF